MLAARFNLSPAEVRRILAVGKIEPPVSLNDVRYYDAAEVARAIQQMQSAGQLKGTVKHET
jgi:hypothetical protein